MIATLPVRRNIGIANRARAAGIHLLISIGFATAAAGLVFGLWYPGLFRAASGGRDLFLLLTGVDVVLGPLLTFAVFDLSKGRAHLGRDLAVIGTIQLAALIYGMHTVYVARPIALVFEVDRFRIITGADIYEPDLSKARPEYRVSPWTRPLVLGTRMPKPGDEHNDAVFMGLRGIDRANRPLFWQPYADSVPDILAKSRPVSALLARYPSRADEFRSRLADIGCDEATARFLPLVARGQWVLLLSNRGEALGEVRADGFF